MLQSMFPEWYEPDDDVLADVVRAGTIALDANVLLSLYRISSVARDDVLNLLSHDHVRPRLFIPYQVGLEYQRNRVAVARGQSSGYNALRRSIDKLKDGVTGLKIANDASGIRDAAVRDEINAAVETANEELSARFDELWTKIEEIRNTHVIKDEDIRRSDPVRNKLEELLADQGQIGVKPDDATLNERTRRATERYKAKIPPGFEDATGKDVKADASGDYLIWRELLDLASKKTGPILFVTDDKKPDWYELDRQDRVLGPRAELRVEMAVETPHPYHQTTLDGFLRLARKHLELIVDDDTVDQVVKAAPERQLFLEPEVPLSVWNRSLSHLNKQSSENQSNLGQYPPSLQRAVLHTVLERLVDAVDDDEKREILKGARNELAHGRIESADDLTQWLTDKVQNEPSSSHERSHATNEDHSEDGPEAED